MPSAESSRRTVLVVCFGNLCRSPMAEALLRDRLPEREWRVISAGTHAAGGAPPTEGSRDAISRLAGLDISAQRSTPLTTSLLASSDHIFAMSRRQAREAAALVPAAATRIRLLGAFAPASAAAAGAADPMGTPAGRLEVADPMGGDQSMYDDCCLRLIESVDAAVDWLLGGDERGDPPDPVSSWPKRT